MQTLGRRWYEEGMQEGIQKGRQEGMKKGELERARKVAKNMLIRGLDIKLISEVTGLSEKEVKEIKRKLKK